MEETNHTELLKEAYGAALQVWGELQPSLKPEQQGDAVLIGGFAVLLYGGPRKDTKDVDLALGGDALLEFEERLIEKARAKNTPFRESEEKNPNKSEIIVYVKGDKKVGIDYLPIGLEYVHKPLATQEPFGLGKGLLADVPDLAIMKARSLYSARNAANDMTDLKFLLQKMIRDGRKFEDKVQVYRRGYWYLYQAVEDDKEADKLLDQVWPVPKAERTDTYNEDSQEWRGSPKAISALVANNGLAMTAPYGQWEARHSDSGPQLSIDKDVLQPNARIGNTHINSNRKAIGALPVSGSGPRLFLLKGFSKPERALIVTGEPDSLASSLQQDLGLPVRIYFNTFNDLSRSSA